MNLKILSQFSIYIVLLICVLSYKFAVTDWLSYKFWQPLIDDLILLIFLGFTYIHSKKWHWFSKRILYTLTFTFFLNTYAKLFGMDPILYLQWYYIPLLIMIYSLSISSIIEITYKLYTLWKNGKIKFF